jgi:hypothetical protein
LKLGGRKQEEEEEAGEAIRGRKGTQIFGIGGRKKKKQREEEESASDEPSLFGTQLFSNFGLKRGESQNGTARGGALVPRKETTALDVLSFGRGRRQDPRTVFVAGATGQTGARISQQLLHAGFNVRGGVGDLFFAQQLAEFATQYGVSLQLSPSLPMPYKIHSSSMLARRCLLLAFRLFRESVPNEGKAVEKNMIRRIGCYFAPPDFDKIP